MGAPRLKSPVDPKRSRKRSQSRNRVCDDVSGASQGTALGSGRFVGWADVADPACVNVVGPSTLPSERHGRHRTQAPLRPTGRVPLAPAPPTPQRHVAAGLSNEMRWPARGSSCGDQGNQERAGDGDRGDRRGQSNDEAQLEESRQKKELGETQAGGRDHKGEDGTDPDA